MFLTPFFSTYVAQTLAHRYALSAAILSSGPFAREPSPLLQSSDRFLVGPSGLPGGTGKGNTVRIRVILLAEIQTGVSHAASSPEPPPTDKPEKQQYRDPSVSVKS